MKPRIALPAVAISMAFGGGLIPYLLGISGDLYSFRSGITILGILVIMASAVSLRLKELESGATTKPKKSAS